MSFEERARIAVREAQGEVQMVEIPESEDVVGRRRAQHRARNAMAGALAILVLGGTAAAVAAVAHGGNNSPTVAHPHESGLPKTALPPAVLRSLRMWMESENSATVKADFVLTTRTSAERAVHQRPSGETTPAYLFNMSAPFEMCPQFARTCTPQHYDHLSIWFGGDGIYASPPLLGAPPLDLSQFGPVGHITLHRPAQMSFAPVTNVVPKAQCTPAMVPAKNGDVCYTLGKAFGNQVGLIGADVVEGSGGEWQLNTHFDQLVMDGINANVGRQVALVVDGVVWSAPTVYDRIGGNDLQITGSFTRNDAVDLAAKLLGLDPSEVSVTPTPTTPPRRATGLGIIGMPASCVPSAPCNLSQNDLVHASDIVRAVARHDATLGWVVDVTLTPAATAKLAHDTQFNGVENTTPLKVQRVGNTFVVSSAGFIGTTLTDKPWDEATAKRIAAAATTA